MPALTFQQPNFDRTRTASMTQPAALGTPLSLRQRMTQHVIEPELLAGYPRLIKRRQSLWDWKQTFLWLATGAQTIGSTSQLHQHPEYFWLVGTCFVILSFLQGFAVYDLFARRNERAKGRQEFELLRYGIPTAAVILDTRKSGESCCLEYLYMDRFGEIQTRTTEVTWDMAQKRGYHTGKLLTVLTSRENEDVLPYPFTDTFTIVRVAPTKITQAISAQILVQAANTPTQVSTSLGLLEPELLTRTPRRIRSRRKFWEAWWLAFGLAALATAIFLGLPTIIHVIKDSGTRLFLLNPITMVLSGLVTVEYLRRGEAKFLKHGKAARARVYSVLPTTGQPPPSLDKRFDVFYEFQTDTGDVYQKCVTMRAKDIRRRAIVEGTIFSVLYLPGDPPVATPYFAIDAYEIVGGTGAQIAPLPKGQP